MSQGTEFVNSWLDAVNRGDLDGLVDMCQPDIELSNPDGSVRGADGVRSAFGSLIEATSERTSQVSNIIEARDSVVAEFVFSGRHTGPLTTPMGPVPATGKTLTMAIIGVYDLRDGKLAASRGMFDRLDLAVQLGLLGAPAPAEGLAP